MFEQHTELRYNYVSFLVGIVMYFSLRYNYVINAFVTITFFYDVRNTLFEVHL